MLACAGAAVRPPARTGRRVLSVCLARGCPGNARAVPATGKENFSLPLQVVNSSSGPFWPCVRAGPPIFQIVEPRTIAVRIAKSVTLAGPGRTTAAVAFAARPGARKNIISVTLRAMSFHFCKTCAQREAVPRGGGKIEKLGVNGRLPGKRRTLRVYRYLPGAVLASSGRDLSRSPAGRRDSSGGHCPW